MGIGITAGLFVLILILIKLIHGIFFRKSGLEHIPGPCGKPIAGNFFQIDFTAAHQSIYNWSKNYKDMFKVNFFGQYTVVLNDYDSISEMLNSEDCSSRIQTYRAQGVLFKDWPDVVFGEFTPEWNEMKKLVTRSLNAYGTGKLKIETITLEYIQELMDNIKDITKEYTKPIDMKPVLHQCISGIIVSLLYGRRMNKTEILLLMDLEKSVLDFVSPAEVSAILDAAPWVRFLPIKSIQKQLKECRKLRKWISERCVKKDTTESERQSILYSFLGYTNKATGENLTAEQINGISINLVTAGFMTTTASMYAFILCLINHPEIQDKMYEEIMVNSEGQAKLGDKSKMPYIMAATEENGRLLSLTPLGLPHMADKNTTIKGQFIPKGTGFFANLWKLHHDEKYFPDPWSFNPERYLTEEGQLLPVSHDLMKRTLPFGAGRRICPGEGLARSRIFLVMSNLLQKFKFLPVDTNNVPSCDPRCYSGDLVLSPGRYMVMVEPR